MVFGARPFGSRSFGDSAPSGAGVRNAISSGTTHFASVTFSADVEMTPDATVPQRASVTFQAAATFTPTGARVLPYASVRFKAAAKVAFVTRIEGDTWRLVAVDLDGTAKGEIENAEIVSFVNGLNSEGAIEFSVPIGDPKADLLPPMREVQVWKGDALLKQGPIFRPIATSKTLGFTGAGLEWYFVRRHFGKADRTNYISNGDFESGLAGWSPGYSYYSNTQAPPAHEITTFPTMTGRRALRLTGAADGHDTFASQVFGWTVDADLSPEGDRFTVVGYVYVESFLGPANEYRGIMLERFSTTELHEDPALAALGFKKSLEHIPARIDEDTPIGQWVKLEAVMTTPPKAGEPEGIRVTLYPPHGTAVFDRISLTVDEATRFHGVDQAQIAEGIVQHLQDPAYGKTDLLIGTHCPPTGVLRDRVYLHSEHENGKGALDDLTVMDDGIDYSVEITPSTRTFTTHYPMKGIDHLDLVLEYGKNVEDFTWAFDGAVAANQVIALGSGDGSAREEGVATDLTALQGVSLEEVYVAVEGADISSLDNRASARLEEIREPVIIELFLAHTDLVGIVHTGDRVKVRIDRDYVQVEDWFRIVRIAVQPKADRMSIVVNRHSEEVV